MGLIDVTTRGVSDANSAAANDAALANLIAEVEGTPRAGGLLFPPIDADILYSGMTFTKPMTLAGQGWRSRLKLANGCNAHAVTFAPPPSTWMPNFRIHGLKFDLNGANQTAGGGVNAKGAVWCRFIDLWMRQPWGNSLWLRDDNMGSFGHHNVISGGLYDQGALSNGGDGRAILFDQSDENLVTGGATFQDNGRPGSPEPNQVYDLAGLNVGKGIFFVGGQTAWKFQGPDGMLCNSIIDGAKNHSVRFNGIRAQLLDVKVYHIGYVGTDLDGAWVDNVDGAQIKGCLFDTIGAGQAEGGTARSAINLSSGPSTNAQVVGNALEQTGLAYTGPRIIRGSGAGHMIRDNRGYRTEAGGIDTVAAGTTSKAVTHGLAETPAVSDIVVSPTNNPTNNVRHWVSSTSAATFTVTTSGDPGAGGLTFAWQARIL